MIPLLPKWNLHGNRPTFYDGDAVTMLELASTLHGSMNMVIEEYNELAENINKIISEFVADANGDREVFETAIRQEFQDFIDLITLKYQEHDLLIRDAKEFVRTMSEEVLGEYIAEGTIRGMDEQARETISRHANAKNNPHSVTLEQVGASPNLGNTGTWVGDLNKATNNGFYSWQETAINTPFGYGSLLVLNRGNTRIIQIGFDPFMVGHGAIAIRHSNGDTWYDWLYLNPPMAFGTEYKTVYRHNGKQVYGTRLYLGALTNTGTTTANLPSVPTEIVELTGTIRSDAYTEELAFPVFTLSGAIGARLSKNASKQILVKTFTDYSAYTATVTVWYTK